MVYGPDLRLLLMLDLALNDTSNPFGYQPWRDQKTFAAMFDTLETDIVVFQETKIQRKDLSDDMVLVPGWDCYWSLPKHKKGNDDADFGFWIGADLVKGTRASSSIHGSRSALPFALKKELLGCFAPRIHPQALPISQTSCKLEATRLTHS